MLNLRESSDYEEKCKKLLNYNEKDKILPGKFTDPKVIFQPMKFFLPKYKYSAAVDPIKEHIIFANNSKGIVHKSGNFASAYENSTLVESR
jgi:hypothetical protein